jgi:UDP-N-acetylmuramate dehydrogenase
MELLINWLRQNAVKYLLDVDLSEFSYMKTGGKLLLLIEPASTEEVAKCLAYFKLHDIKHKVIGATSNLLFLDNTNYSCFLTTSSLKELRLVGDSQFIAGSGHMLPDVSRYALYNSITGFEGLEGIPGTIGGAVFMNAGAYGYEIKNVLEFVEIVDLDGNVKVYNTNDLKLTKRNSALRNGTVKGVVTKCGFKGKKRERQMIEQEMEIYHSKRHKYLEYLYPNLGSVFSGSIYRELGRNDKYFYIMSSLFYLLNYKWKLFRRESPINRKWINDIAVKRFSMKYQLQPFSDKTLNCIVNRGQGTDEMIRYIREIDSLTKGRIPVENEIVEKF